MVNPCWRTNETHTSNTACAVSERNQSFQRWLHWPGGLHSVGRQVSGTTCRVISTDSVVWELWRSLTILHQWRYGGSFKGFIGCGSYSYCTCRFSSSRATTSETNQVGTFGKLRQTHDLKIYFRGLSKSFAQTKWWCIIMMNYSVEYLADESVSSRISSRAHLLKRSTLRAGFQSAKTKIRICWMEFCISKK